MVLASQTARKRSLHKCALPLSLQVLSGTIVDSDSVAIITQIRVKYKHYFSRGMTMATIDERIASLELKLQQEKAKRSQIEARKRSAAKKKQHAEDTRRKILVGAMVLNMVDSGAWP